MVDLVPRAKRSEMMSNIRAAGSKPEMQVRRALHAAGYRYRVHANDLPGRPDIVFRGRKKVIFVHGCFWHQHKECANGRLPKSNTDFWRGKLARNVERDEEQVAALKALGWSVSIVWECEVKSDEAISRLKKFLRDDETPESESGTVANQ